MVGSLVGLIFERQSNPFQIRLFSGHRFRQEVRQTPSIHRMTGFLLVRSRPSLTFRRVTPDAVTIRRSDSRNGKPTS